MPLKISGNLPLKQVIVIRKDLKMRRGKEIAQGCHASLGAFLNARGSERSTWMEQGATKITVVVNSEAELDALLTAARKADLPGYLVVDAGKTEFNGVPTKTALAIGPAATEQVDKVTKDLKLY